MRGIERGLLCLVAKLGGNYLNHVISNFDYNENLKKISGKYTRVFIVALWNMRNA